MEQVIAQTMESDIPQYADMKASTTRNFKKMLSVLAQLTLFKPNMDSLAAKIGGRSKGRKQIENIPHGIVVKDDIETGHGLTVPLWQFGLNY